MHHIYVYTIYKLQGLAHEDVQNTEYRRSELQFSQHQINILACYQNYIMRE